MKVAIITDSGANLSPEVIKQHPNLFVLPLMIIINGKSFKDQVEVTADQVYAKLDTSTITSSLPSLGELDELIQKLKLEGYTDILAINLSSGLSGTYNAFRLAFQSVEGIHITHYDSKTLAAGLGYIIEYALELVKAKTPIASIIPLLEKLRFEDSLAMYTINTLKYLRKGGRIGKVEGTIGDILHIKPVITVNEKGVYVTLSKAFGLQRSLISMRKALLAKFDHELIDFTIHYGNGREKAQALAEMIKKEFNIRNLTLSPLTPVLGIHTGPEMFAYIARRVR
ncbi:MAG: DegV family protein [Candidatus Izemoplasmatales bacterium]|jgi:DegV family protein with EDD domain|nr:DegV family protein [Candidatus Izemoplasmatales bacterium]